MDNHMVNECKECAKGIMGNCGVNVCPMDKTGKLVEVTTDEMETYEAHATGIHTINGKPVTLFAIYKKE